MADSPLPAVGAPAGGVGLGVVTTRNVLSVVVGSPERPQLAIGEGGGHGHAGVPNSPGAPPASPHADVAKSKSKNAERDKALVAAADKKNGLSSAAIPALREQYGFNELEEKKRNAFLMFLSFLWGPMPIMIWVAIIIEFAQALITGEAWADFTVLLILQFANAIVGFIEEFNAGNAIDALKKNLALNANVLRDGKTTKIPARELVPGDVVEIKLGDVIPADGILCEGKPVQVDQAALTGESLPVTAGPGTLIFMSSALKMGHTHFVVTSTGKDTFIGTAAKLMNSVVHQTNLQKVLLGITVSLLVMCIVACAAIFIKLMLQPEPPGAVTAGAGDSRFLRSLSIVVVILVASIPVAIEVVVTSTMAVGSHVMASKKVIVARLSAIEELAGMTILCSDKTGTLTLNKLGIRDPILFSAESAGELLYYAALASKRVGDLDAIELCINNAVPEPFKSRLLEVVEEDFTPFDPVSKRTMAVCVGPDGRRIKVSKGAPQVILRMAHDEREIAARVRAAVDDLASRGFRSLGVAVAHVGVDEEGAALPDKWEYMGILSLFDPPRPDSKETIAKAIEYGVLVKMITGDHGKIAKETCRELGMGTEILDAEILDDATRDAAEVDRIIMRSHGFAEVMPEHKFAIVDRIRKMGFITGMTGDGVNDAPALKRADIGIAVHGATDAARAAAAIVLTEEGISVIITAMFESRKIFQRMRNYILYRIACTLQLLFFFFFGILCIDGDGSYMYQGLYYVTAADVKTANLPDAYFLDSQHAPSFSLPVLALVIITILNDGCMITISGDHVTPENRPQMWEMWKVWTIAGVLGFVACFSSLLLLAAGMHANYLNPNTYVGRMWGSGDALFLRWDELKTIMYLKISISDFLTLFSARTRSGFWERSLSWPLSVAFVVATGSSTIISLVWGDIFPVGNGNYMASLRFSYGAVVYTWLYCVVWWFVQDAAKVATYWLLDNYIAKPPLTPAEAEAAELKRVAAGEDILDSVVDALGGHAPKATAKGGKDDRAERMRTLSVGVVTVANPAARSSSAVFTGAQVVVVNAAPPHH